MELNFLLDQKSGIMAFYTQFWFWLLVIALLFIIVGIIFHFSGGHTGWVIFFMFFGIFLLLIAILAAAITGAAGVAEKQSERAFQFASTPEGQQLIKTAVLA